MKLEVITITRRDIEHGVQSDCWHCPGALAVQRHFLPDCRFDRVSIDNGIIVVTGVGVFNCPASLNEWIGEYDSGGGQIRAKPLTFHIWNLPQGRADFKWGAYKGVVADVWNAKAQNERVRYLLK